MGGRKPPISPFFTVFHPHPGAAGIERAEDLVLPNDEQSERVVRWLRITANIKNELI
jgi:hypothetical protein